MGRRSPHRPSVNYMPPGTPPTGLEARRQAGAPARKGPPRPWTAPTVPSRTGETRAPVHDGLVPGQELKRDWVPARSEVTKDSTASAPRATVSASEDFSAVAKSVRTQSVTAIRPDGRPMPIRTRK